MAQVPMLYLDNNIVSAIAKDDTPTESDALRRLLVAREEGRLEFVTSEITLEEIKRYAGEAEAKPLVEQVYEQIRKIPVVRWDELVGIQSYGDARTWINAPIIENDPLYDVLLKAGLKTIDARHVFVAAKHGCNVFLSCDRGILARARVILDACGLIVQRPSGFLASGTARRRRGNS